MRPTSVVAASIKRLLRSLESAIFTASNAVASLHHFTIAWFPALVYGRFGGTVESEYGEEPLARHCGAPFAGFASAALGPRPSAGFTYGFHCYFSFSIAGGCQVPSIMAVSGQ